MLQELWSGIEWLLGLSDDDLNVGQMVMRAMMVFPLTLIMVRLGEKRFLGKSTAFDVVLAIITFRSDRFGSTFKGEARTLVEDGGETRWNNMAHGHISQKDFLQALRVNGKVSDPREVAVAGLERSGDISVIPKRGDPKVFEVSVEHGVQTVRVELNA